MRILLVNAKPTLADALAAHSGVDVALVWPRHHHFRDVPPPTLVQPCFYRGGGKLNPAAIWQLRNIIQRTQPDVVHAFYGRALAHVVLAATALRRRPGIVSFRGVSSPLSKLDAGDWLTYRHPLVDAHACESEAVQRALVQSGVDDARCFVTYNSMHMQPASRPGRAPWRNLEFRPMHSWSARWRQCGVSKASTSCCKQRLDAPAFTIPIGYCSGRLLTRKFECWPPTCGSATACVWSAIVPTRPSSSVAPMFS